MGWWVVIVAFNRYDLVRKSAAAFLAQVPAPERVVVVDNSDAPDRGALDGLAVEWLLGHDDEGRNSGSAGGFGRGMDYAFAHGATYAVLSDQDFLPDGKLLVGLAAAAQRYPAAAVSSFTVDPTTDEIMPSFLAVGPGQPANQLCLTENRHEMAQTLGWKVTHKRFTSLAEVRAYAAGIGADVGRVPLAGPHGLAISREIHASIGTFRSEFFVGWEDCEYCCRLQDSGFLLLVAFGAFGYHHLSWHNTVRIGPLSVKVFSNSPRRFYFHLRNSIVMARERARGCLFAKWLLRLCYHSVVYLVLGPSTTIERAVAIRHAWRTGLSNFPIEGPAAQVPRP